MALRLFAGKAKTGKPKSDWIPWPTVSKASKEELWLELPLGSPDQHGVRNVASVKLVPATREELNHWKITKKSFKMAREKISKSTVLSTKRATILPALQTYNDFLHVFPKTIEGYTSIGPTFFKDKNGKIWKMAEE